MKKAIFGILTVFGLVSHTMSASSIQYQLIVTCGESNFKYVLATKPVVTFEDQQMIVTVEDESFTEFERSEVTDLRFDEVETGTDTPNKPTNIEQSEKEPLRTMTFTYIDGRNIYLENVKENARISAYDMTGRLLRPEINRNGENVTVNLDNVPSGALVVVVGNKSYKIIKPRK